MYPGIVIQYSGGLGRDSIPISANSGIYSEESEQSGGCRFLPRDDWRPLFASEQAMLFAPQAVPFSDAVTVFRTTTAIRDFFWEKTVPVVSAGASKISPQERSTSLWDCADQVVNAISEVGIAVSSLRSCDVQITPSPSNSTAFDYSRGHFIGLHIDNHDKLTLAGRRSAFHLLCLNLGQEERHLHFVNIGAADMAARLELNAAHAEQRYAEAWKLTRDFFHQYPNYPVVRITLPPTYGYIAVTQNFVHDGGTNSSGHPDVALLLAGQYKFKGN